MSDVLVSYSRKDLRFVERLRVLLEADDLDVWVDTEGLYAGEEFWPEIAKAIDAAVAVVFVLTPDSVASRVCQQELSRADEGKKRVVPVCHRDVDTEGLHPALARHQWVFFRDGDDPEAARESLLSAIRADWVELRRQARLLVRSREWEAGSRDDSLVLRGRDLREAEEWLERNRGEAGRATALHAEFIGASRQAARRRRLRLAGFVAAALATIAIVGWFGMGKWIASRNNSALVDLGQGRVKEAIGTLEWAASLCARTRSAFDACRDVRLNLGLAYLDASRYEEALARLSLAIDAILEAETQDPVVEDYRATAHQSRSLTHIMLAERESDPAQRLLGYARAEEDLAVASAIFESSPSGGAKPVRITRARILLGRGNYSEALAELEQASRMSDQPDIDLLLSVAHRCLGEGERSVESFQRYIGALKGGPADPHFRRNKDYYKRLGERCTPEQS